MSSFCAVSHYNLNYQPLEVVPLRWLFSGPPFDMTQYMAEQRKFLLEKDEVNKKRGLIYKSWRNNLFSKVCMFSFQIASSNEQNINTFHILEWYYMIFPFINASVKFWLEIQVKIQPKTSCTPLAPLEFWCQMHLPLSRLILMRKSQQSA